MSDDRNFRNCYYTKIDQKKSLDILLREKPPDLLLKVSQLTSRQGLLMNRRKQVWQLLLDVVQADSRIAENRITVQRNIVKNILDALKLIDYIHIDFDALDINVDDERFVKEYEDIMILVLLFESKQLKIHYHSQLKEEIVKDYQSIANVFIREFMQASQGPFADTFWLFRNFIQNIEIYSTVLLETYEKFLNHLHDHEPELFQHFIKIGIIQESDKNTDKKLQQNSSSNSSPYQQHHHHHHYQSPGSQYHHQHYQNSQQQTSPNLQVSHSSLNISQVLTIGQSSPFSMSPQLTPSLGKLPNKHSKSQPKILNDWKYQLNLRRPLITWFVRFFSGLIHHNFIIRIFDKIICCFVHEARTFHVLLSIAKSLIAHTKKELLSCANIEQITQRLFKPLTLEESEKIVDKSLAT